MRALGFLVAATLCACSSVHGKEPSGRVEQWIQRDSPFYECPSKRAFLIGTQDAPRVLMMPGPTCISSAMFEPYLMTRHFREGDADHFVVWSETSPRWANELVIPVDRTRDGEIRTYHESVPGGVSITEGAGGRVILRGAPIETATCWSPARKGE
ncbi:hypothetical protein [Polyangium sp. y55x31]|uniref:hypothetical protein n=1 Tax=Polyangium sp. y55x31 TaxID=3042688 RepID=UPI002482FDFB|nr:hypothetical protein [Polyangium sp. y55x31]MDI1484145.1 hypothetical protein [Polyangium sp. y55x31]